MNADISYSAVDLFSGVGGLTHGLILEGIRVNAGIDLDPACKYPYEKNNESRFVESDVSTISTDEVAQSYPEGDIKILVGCAPCQPFSAYTRGRNPQMDTKWDLLHSFSKLVEGIEPEIVSMENVPNLMRHQVYSDFKETLENLGYHVWASKVYGPHYGIPQTRIRLVLLASKLGPIRLLPPTHTVETCPNVYDIIGHLDPIGAGAESENDPLHRSSGLTQLNLRRIRASRPGGSWREWKKDLIANCHRRKGGSTYPSVYGRMEWHKQGPTITTQFYGFGNGRFGHPEQDRALSLREGALLQTFPETYQFVHPDEPIQTRTIGRLIGNAVPVELGRVIGKSIKTHLDQYVKR